MLASAQRVYVNFNASCKIEATQNREKTMRSFAKSVADIDHQFENQKARCIDVRTTSGIYEKLMFKRNVMMLGVTRSYQHDRLWHDER